MSETTAGLSTLAQKINQELGVSDGVTLDHPRIDEFAHCTGDDQWIQLIPTESTVEIEGGDKPALIGNTLVMAMAR